MEWEDVSTQARSVMKELGNFGPTVNILDRYVKGYTIGAGGESARTYYDSNDLRVIAASCVEVADWLDKRAATLSPNASSERGEK